MQAGTVQAGTVQAGTRACTVVVASEGYADTRMPVGWQLTWMLCHVTGQW